MGKADGLSRRPDWKVRRENNNNNHNRPVIKILHHAVNITSTEAELFAISGFVV